MANLNRVLLIGNLTRDPELRVTPKGAAVCTFSMAVNRKWKDESGEKEEVTYLDVEAWNKAGEAIAKYCTKGKPLFIEGRLKLEQWEDKTTKEKRSKIKVVCENFQFLGSAKDSPANANAERYAPPAPKPTAPAQENLDEDVPF